MHIVTSEDRTVAITGYEFYPNLSPLHYVPLYSLLRSLRRFKKLIILSILDLSNFLFFKLEFSITIAVFIGLTFLISIIFICLACCIICQRKRAQEQNRCMQRRSLNNNVYFNSNNQFVSILERNQQIAEVAGDNNINTIYKPYGAYSYEDLNPPAYSTLKFN